MLNFSQYTKLYEAGENPPVAVTNAPVAKVANPPAAQTTTTTYQQKGAPSKSLEDFEIKMQNIMKFIEQKKVKKPTQTPAKQLTPEQQQAKLKQQEQAKKAADDRAVSGAQGKMKPKTPTPAPAPAPQPQKTPGP